MSLQAKPGARFTVSIADGVVLMEARSIRCGDVWDCYPVDTGDEYADEYGHHMIFTDEEVARKSEVYEAFEKKGAQRRSVWPRR